MNKALLRRGWILFALLTATLAVAPMAHAQSPDSGKPVTIWTDGDQFVQLAPRDLMPDGSRPPANAHPASARAEDIAAALSRLRFQRGDNQHALFDATTAGRLATPLSKALGQVSPNQDVLFAVLMWIKSPIMGSSDVTVAGRVFFLDNRMHVIVGDLHRSAVAPEFYRSPNASRKIDRRTHPHVPGQRARETLFEDDIRFDTGAGVELFRAGDKPRGDWLVLDIAAARAVPVLTAPSEPAPAAPVAEPARPAAAPSFEERLIRLKRLREQNLITEDEYARKRKAVLDEL